MQSPSSTSHTPSRARRVHPLLLVVLLIQVLSYAPRLSNTFQFNRFNHDDTECYVALGWSVAEGRGYTRSLDPTYYVPHKLWPPGLPLMVAACAVLSRSLVLPQILMMLFALANSVLLWALARRYLPTTATFLVLLMVVCSPMYDRLATVIMTEQPTLLFILLVLWAFLRWRDSGYASNRFALLTAGGLAYGILVKMRAERLPPPPPISDALVCVVPTCCARCRTTVQQGDDAFWVDGAGLVHFDCL